MRLNYISNTPKNVSSGGGSGVNTAVYKFLEKKSNYFKYQYINPPVVFWERILSRFLKVLKIPRGFYFFSEKRLKLIKQDFSIDSMSDLYFFHGFTPWIKIVPNRPYFCFNDACFSTYISMYNPSQYLKSDLQRIFQQEAKWLQDASIVFFRSNWALEETKRYYNLTGENFLNVGRGGFIDIPNSDLYLSSPKKKLLFVSNMFYQKGGKTLINAFKKIRAHFGEDIELLIIGEKPDKNDLSIDGVIYKGYFNKSIVSEMNELIEIFRKATLLIHPSNVDTNPIVISELNFFGCPAIASNKFAIPELIDHNKTGYLLNDNNDSEELAEVVISILSNEEKYLLMRKECRILAINNHSWDSVLPIIYEKVKTFLPNE